MRRYLITIALVLLSQAAMAAPRIVVLDLGSLSPGTYYYAVTIGPDGKVSFAKIAQLVTLNGDGGGEIVTPAPKPFSKLTAMVNSLSQKIQGAAHERIRRQLSSAYKTMAQEITDGSVASPKSLVDAQRALNDAIINGHREAWKPFFDELKKLLDRMSAGGNLVTLRDYQGAWQAIAEGLK